MARFMRWVIGLLVIAAAALFVCAGLGISMPTDVIDPSIGRQLSQLWPFGGSERRSVGENPEIGEADDASDASDHFRYKQLDSGERRVYRELLGGVRGFSESFSVSSSDTDVISKCINAMLDDHPEIFWFAGSANISSRQLLRTSTVKPMYSYSKAEAGKARVKIEAAADGLIDGFEGDMGTYSKVKAIYEYVIEHTDYGSAGNDQNIVGVFIDHKAVCAGYTRAFEYLMHRAGLYCAYVRGSAANTSGKTDSHSWNIVRIGKKYYHVDCTWGDPTYLGESGNTGGVSYNYLCVTSAEIGRTHRRNTDIQIPDCTSTRYDYYRMNGAYFDEYYRGDVVTALVESIDAGQASGGVKFGSEEVYRSAISDLVEGGGISDRRITSRLQVAGESYRQRYVRDDAMYVLRFVWR